MAASAIARLVEYFTLGCICLLASSIRLFSVIKYESVIHEFDPYVMVLADHINDVAPDPTHAPLLLYYQVLQLPCHPVS